MKGPERGINRGAGLRRFSDGNNAGAILGRHNLLFLIGEALAGQAPGPRDILVHGHVVFFLSETGFVGGLG